MGYKEVREKRISIISKLFKKKKDKKEFVMEVIEMFGVSERKAKEYIKVAEYRNRK